MQKEKVVIIGSGPAGLTAALYTARANLMPLVIAGPQLGGQVSLTHEIENYPGFAGGSGPDLIEVMKKQAEQFGARIDMDVVLSVDLSNGSPFTVKTGNSEYLAEALIVTSGASPRLLGVPGEAEYTGRGVSYCGTCDAFFFRNKEVVVVGGGDSAIKEGIFLTKFANKVNVVHRRDTLRAEATQQQRAYSNPKMSFTWDTIVEEVVGDGKVKAVKLHNLKTGERTEYPTDGVFIFIGHDPNNSILKGQLAMDEHGYVIIDRLMQTSVEGVFAAGEIADPLWKQVATSVGQGCAAAISTEQWLAKREGGPVTQAEVAARITVSPDNN